MTSRFNLTVQQLRSLNEKRDLETLSKYGGMEKIFAELHSNPDSGIPDTPNEIADRQATFGSNVMEEPPLIGYFAFLYNALKEPILILLIVCSIVEIILGATVDHGATGWIDGLAILIAVILVSNVTAGTDYDKQKKFRALNSVKNDRKVKVRRGGKQDVVSITQIVVGDVVILDTGDWVPADGIFIDGHGLGTDESAMTGEPDTIKKSKNKPFLLSGTQVAEGSGAMLATAVGVNSEWGILYSKLKGGNEETPLQESLGHLAKTIGYIGTAVGILIFVVLTIQFIAEEVNADSWEWDKLRELLQFFTLAITIVVVAVPEGLPLAVTISLAYSMKAMLKDNNLVRHLAACETMGGATNICSDKTGTLTENRMTVTNAWFGDLYISDKLESLPEKLSKPLLDTLSVGIATNSSAFLRLPSDDKHKIEFIGSKTECALLVLSNKLNYNYEKIRKDEKVLQVFPFSSEKKRMSTLIKSDSGARLHVKGASEIILGLCSTYLDSNNKSVPLTSEKSVELKKVIDTMASEGLRTLSLAFKELKDDAEEYTASPDSDLTLIGVVGIKDPLRPEVAEAIRQCKSAGIVVRMVTGDNKITASKIASDCGILTEGGEVLEGPDFRELSDEDLDAKIPKLQVLARSSPSDKYRLVTRLKALKEVVAVTGDGTNDAPALKAANVGFGMGIAGTEVAKEAADIIIMDDNFASIVKAVMWGRCVRGNIQKFLQFQLTVNIVALTVAFIAAASGKGEPLKPIQFLWVNLIQDTFAALALATEKPTPNLLNNPPAGRTERLITPVMWRNMLAISAYQIAILFMILFAGDQIWSLNEPDKGTGRAASVQYTILFNTFVFLQLFNEINCRQLDNDWTPFRNFFSNWLFIGIIVGSAVAQAIFIEFGGEALATKPLNVAQWFACLGLGLSVLIVGTVVRVLIPAPQWPWLKYRNVPIPFLPTFCSKRLEVVEEEEELEELKAKV